LKYDECVQRRMQHFGQEGSFRIRQNTLCTLMPIEYVPSRWMDI
jgi:hypothetical protein